MRRALFRHAAQNLASQIVVAIAAVVVSIVVARTLGPDETGVYSVATFGALIAITALTLGGPLILTRHVAEAAAAEDRDRIAALLAVVDRWALAVAAVVVAIAGVVAAAGWTGSLTTAEFVVAAAVVPPGVLFALLTAVLSGERRFERLLRLNAAVSALQLAAVGAVAVAGGDLVHFLLVVAAAPVVQSVLAYRALRGERDPAARLDDPGRRALRRDVGSVSGIVVLDVIIFQRSEVFFLAALSSSRQVAYFALAQALVSRAISFLPGAVTGVLLPTFAGADDLEHRVAVSIRWLALLALPLGAVLVAVAPALIEVLYGSEYAPMAPVVAIVAVAAALTSLATVASSAVYAEGRHGFILRVAAVGALCNVALAFALIPPFDAVGAAVAGGLTQVGCAAAGVVYIRRTLGLRLPVAAVVKTLASAVAAAAAAAGVLVAGLPVGAELATACVAFGAVFVAALLASRAVPDDERRALAAAVSSRAGARRRGTGS